MIKRILIILTLIIITIGLLFTYNLLYSSTDYNRAIYAIVLHNDTEKKIDNIKVLYGNISEQYNNTYEYANNIEIMPQEYKKILIPTTNPIGNPPYNVYVEMLKNNEN